MLIAKMEWMGVSSYIQSLPVNYGIVPFLTTTFLIYHKFNKKFQWLILRTNSKQIFGKATAYSYNHNIAMLKSYAILILQVSSEIKPQSTFLEFLFVCLSVCFKFSRHHFNQPWTNDHTQQMLFLQTDIMTIMERKQFKNQVLRSKHIADTFRVRQQTIYLKKCRFVF